MVQFFPASRRSIQREQLGAAAGQGLTKLFNSYQMNKSINQAMNSNEYKSGTPYERADVLQRAMQGHGPEGRQFLQERLGLEQMRNEEIQQQAISRIVQGKESPEDVALLPPEFQFKLKQKRDLERARSDAFKALPKALKKGEERDVDAERQSFFAKLSNPNLTDNDRKFLMQLHDRNFPQQKPLTLYQEAYLDQQNQALEQRKSEFAIKLAEFKDKPVQERLKESNNYFDTELKAVQSLLSNRRVASSPEAAEELHGQIKELNRKKSAAQQKIMGNRPLDLKEDFGIEEGLEQEPQAASEIDQQQQPTKVRFDPRNPNHVRRAKEVLETVNGDRARANEILFTEFDK